MGHSKRLKLSDVRDAGRLVREVCELGDDVVAWRSHLLRTLCASVGASGGVSFAASLSFNPAHVPMTCFVAHDIHPKWLGYFADRDVTPDPCTPMILPRLAAGLNETSLSLVGEKVWRNSFYYNEMLRPIGVDHYSVSVLPLAASGSFNGLGLIRDAGEPAFRRRDLAIIGIVQGELGHVWRQPPRRVRPAWEESLSPRLKQVLAALQSGLSEKQVAARLGLHAATVHNHVTRLYRAAAVNSRSELLVATQAPPNRRPRLV